MVQLSNARLVVLVLLVVAGIGLFAFIGLPTPECPVCDLGSTDPDQQQPQNNTPCAAQVKCEEAPPCVCPACPKPKTEMDEPCPEVVTPPVIAHPCPVPEPCPEQAQVSERDKHKWDGRTVTTGPSPWKETCVWKTVLFSPSIKYDMCVRGYSDIVSDAIRNNGRWGDCDVLVRMWGQPARAAKAVQEKDSEGIFVDAGANIGSCSLLMGAAGHTTYGFEPLRANLFYLTSGILGNEAAIREKISIYQLGLGTHSLNASAFAASGNAGNTQLDSMVKDWGSQTWKKEDYIPVMSLDDILWPNAAVPPPHIRLMKMDVQGYEVKILKGAARLLEAGAIGIVKSELTTMFLHGQGTTAMEMIDIMTGHGYELTGHDDEVAVDPSRVRDGEVVFRYKEKAQ